MHYVIGTLDQHDQNINNLKNRQDFLSSLIINHTSILENTSSLIQKTHQDVLDQFELFNKHLNKIDLLRNWDHVAADLNQHLNTLSTFTTITRFRNTQMFILNTLTQAYSTGLQLLTPALLHKELLAIEKNLPNTLHLPKTNHQLDTELTVKISKLEARIEGNRLVCVLHIPLMLNSNFQLFRAISVPARGPSGFSYIEPH